MAKVTGLSFSGGGDERAFKLSIACAAAVYEYRASNNSGYRSKTPLVEIYKRQLLSEMDRKWAIYAIADELIAKKHIDLIPGDDEQVSKLSTTNPSFISIMEKMASGSYIKRNQATARQMFELVTKKFTNMISAMSLINYRDLQTAVLEEESNKWRKRK